MVETDVIVPYAHRLREPDLCLPLAMYRQLAVVKGSLQALRVWDFVPNTNVADRGLARACLKMPYLDAVTCPDVRILKSTSSTFGRS
jgi:hypothetical protein